MADENPLRKGASRSAPYKGKSLLVKRQQGDPCHICGTPGKAHPGHFHACFFCPTCCDYIQGNKESREHHLKHCGVKQRLQLQCPYCLKTFGEKGITAHVGRIHKGKVNQWRKIKDQLVREAYTKAVEENIPIKNKEGASLMHLACRPRKTLEFTPLPAIQLAMSQYLPEEPFHDDLSRLNSWDAYCKTYLYKLQQEFLNKDEVSYAFRTFLREKEYKFYAGPSGIVPLFNFSKHCGHRFFAFTAPCDSMRVNAQKRGKGDYYVGESSKEAIPEVIFIKLEPLDESMGNGSHEQAQPEPDEPVLKRTDSIVPPLAFPEGQVMAEQQLEEPHAPILNAEDEELEDIPVEILNAILGNYEELPTNFDVGLFENATTDNPTNDQIDGEPMDTDSIL